MVDPDIANPSLIEHGPTWRPKIPEVSLTAPSKHAECKQKSCLVKLRSKKGWARLSPSDPIDQTRSNKIGVSIDPSNHPRLGAIFQAVGRTVRRKNLRIDSGASVSPSMGRRGGVHVSHVALGHDLDTREMD